MKNIITILILLVASCVTRPDRITWQEKFANSVAGKYVHPVVDKARMEIIFRKDKVYERSYFDNEGKNVTPLGGFRIGRWEVINREVVATSQGKTVDGFLTMFFRIEANGDLTEVAGGWTKQDGKVERKDSFTEGFKEYKKLKE